MYKAVSTQTGEEIIILSPQWRKRIDQLREMDHSDELVCQGCRQPLRVKAGKIKRAHFAHKHLKACSYGSESPEILNARAVLYEWLMREFCPPTGSRTGLLAVTVEKVVEGLNLPRPIDCWVETEGGPIAYWIVETGIKIEPREAILSAFKQMGANAHFVMLKTMLSERKEELDSLLLTPTERAFLKATEFDPVLAGTAEPGKSLHYLDTDSSVLTTYRNLVLFHAPNWYKGVKKTGKLFTVRASRVDGGFVHRGEVENLRRYRQRMERREEKRKKYQEREVAWSNRFARRKQGDDRERASLRNGFREPLPCVLCGQITTDYWSTFTEPSGRRLCRCRECLERDSKQS